jgi:hypothetical protein
VERRRVIDMDKLLLLLACTLLGIGFNNGWLTAGLYIIAVVFLDAIKLQRMMV